MHPFDSEDVHIWNVSVVGPRWLGGVSGIHPDSSRNVVIEDCFVDVGDDGIVVASKSSLSSIPPFSRSRRVELQMPALAYCFSFSLCFLLTHARCFLNDVFVLQASYHDFYGVPKPAANITVRRCTVLSRNIAIGAGTDGGIHDIMFEDCIVGDDSGSSPCTQHYPTGI